MITQYEMSALRDSILTIQSMSRNFYLDKFHTNDVTSKKK